MLKKSAASSTQISPTSILQDSTKMEDIHLEATPITSAKPSLLTTLMDQAHWPSLIKLMPLLVQWLSLLMVMILLQIQLMFTILMESEMLSTHLTQTPLAQLIQLKLFQLTMQLLALKIPLWLITKLLPENAVLLSLDHLRVLALNSKPLQSLTSLTNTHGL